MDAKRSQFRKERAVPAPAVNSGPPASPGGSQAVGWDPLAGTSGLAEVGSVHPPVAGLCALTCWCPLLTGPALLWPPLQERQAGTAAWCAGGHMPPFLWHQCSCGCTWQQDRCAPDTGEAPRPPPGCGSLVSAFSGTFLKTGGFSAYFSPSGSLLERRAVVSLYRYRRGG